MMRMLVLHPAEWRIVSKVREHHIPHALSAGEAQQLSDLVDSYPNTLYRSTKPMRMGLATLRDSPITFDIELVQGGLESVKYKLRKPYAFKRPIRDILKSTQIEMEKAGVGFHNPLNFAPEISSPSFFVHQKDKYRWVQDYRVLNCITKDFLYPIPDIDFIVENLTGSSYFSILDLRLNIGGRQKYSIFNLQCSILLTLTFVIHFKLAVWLSIAKCLR